MRTLARFFIILLCLMLPTYLAYADVKKIQFRDETLSLPVPDSWVLAYQAQNDSEVIREFIPHGQTVEKWTDMITVQIFPRLVLVQPEEFLKKIGEESQKVCTDFRIKIYPIARTDRVTALQYCTKYNKTGLGEITMLLAIKGKNAMYVVQRAWRGAEFKLDKLPYTEQDSKQWFDMMEKVQLN